jgi:hypothetical protein
MKRLLIAFALAAATLGGPALAQPREPSAADYQAVLADVGAWSLQEQAAMDRAIAPLLNANRFVEILENFTAGRARADEASSALEAWRTEGLAALAEARAAAEALPPPPSLALMGSQAASLSRVLNGARDSLLPTIHEIDRVLNTLTDLGLASLSDPGKLYQVRRRALLEAQIQLVRVDLARIELNAASLGNDHPNQALMVATQHYYATLLAVPTHALAEMDGGGNRTELVSSLRQSAARMRVELDRADALAQRTVTELRAMLQLGEGAELVRTVLAAAETYPSSVRAYHGLADGIDVAAASIERGADTLDVWADQEESDMAHLEEIARLERVRVTLIANSRGTL